MLLGLMFVGFYEVCVCVCRTLNDSCLSHITCSLRRAQLTPARGTYQYPVHPHKQNTHVGARTPVCTLFFPHLLGPFFLRYLMASVALREGLVCRIY